MQTIIAFILGIAVGVAALRFYTKRQNASTISRASALFGKSIPSNAVVVEGERGRNGGGDAGAGLYWDTGLAVMPGRAGQGAGKLPE